MVGRFLLPLLVLLSCVSCLPSGTEHLPRAEKGVLDLSGHDFRQQGVVDLDGEWQFYRSQLLYGSQPRSFNASRAESRTVPDLWSEANGHPGGLGYGTYRLRVFLPDGSPPLALRWRTISTAFNMDINGKSGPSAGEAGSNPLTTVAAYRPGVYVMEEPGNHLDIIVRVANWDYRNGGLWRSITLGPKAEVIREKDLADFSGVAITTALLAIGFNSLAVFLFRRQEKSHLYFALFSIVMALRGLVTGEYLLCMLLPGLPFITLIRLEYLTMALSMAVSTALFVRFFSFGIWRPTHVTLVVLPLVYCLFVLLAPLPWLTRSPFAFYLFSFVAILYLFVRVLIPAIRLRIQGSRIVFAGAVLLVLAAVNDALHASFIIRSLLLMPASLVVFLMLQMTALAGRFAGTINRTQGLADELAESNKRLQEEIVVNVQKQSELEGLVEEKDLLIREVHHRVKNSLNIVTSILSLQARRSRSNAETDTLRVLRLRIQALSLVHEKLYTHVSTGSIMLRDYLDSLVRHLASGYGLEQGAIRVELPDSEFEVGVDNSVDLGLMVTELVSNACKYGQVRGERPAIRLSLVLTADELILAIADQGPGFPEGFDPQDNGTLGFLMIQTLLKRCRGSLVLRNDSGAVAELHLPLEEIRT